MIVLLSIIGIVIVVVSPIVVVIIIVATSIIGGGRIIFVFVVIFVSSLFSWRRILVHRLVSIVVVAVVVVTSMLLLLFLFFNEFGQNRSGCCSHAPRSSCSHLYIGQIIGSIIGILGRTLDCRCGWIGLALFEHWANDRGRIFVLLVAFF